MFDVVLENCLIVEKSGTCEANIAVKDGSIAKIGREKFEGKKNVDCQG